jgi:hypothetical protein
MEIQASDILDKFSLRENPAFTLENQAFFAGLKGKKPTLADRMEQLSVYYLDRMELRIGEIGVQACLAEIQDMRKILLGLSVLFARSPAVRDEVEAIVRDFEALPPKSAQEMMDRIHICLMDAAEREPDIQDHMRVVVHMVARMNALSLESVEALANKHHALF